MSDIGKKVRIERIIDRRDGNTLIVPMDHGISVGPIDGLADMAIAVDLVARGGADAVLIHKGIVAAGKRGFEGYLEGKYNPIDVGLIIHLSAGTSLGPDPLDKEIVTTVEEALILGADAVSVHTNFGAPTEPKMLKDLGSVARKCNEWQVPLLDMAYYRTVETQNNKDKKNLEYDVEKIKHVARAGAEAGADMIKCNYTGKIKTFKEVVKGCPVPVVIAGGPKAGTDEEILEMVYGAMKAGGKGGSIGRNIFQHESPMLIANAISVIVHPKRYGVGNYDNGLDEAYDILKTKELAEPVS